MRRIGARAFAFWWGQGIADDVPALTYYLLLSLAPTALGVAAIQGLLLDGPGDAARAAEALNQFLPAEVHDDVRRLIVSAQGNSSLLLAVAVGAMLWTTSGAIGVVERVESRLLDCPRHDVVLGRLRNVGLGLAVAAALVVATVGAPVIGQAAAALELGGALGFLRLLVAIAGSIGVFTVVFRFAPRSLLRWRTAFIGAVPAGIGLQVVPTVVGLYFGAAAGLEVVQVFLLLAVLLLGLYMMAAVMLIGAGVAVGQELRRRHRKSARVPGAPTAMGPERRRRQASSL